ncbi:hypothetical protein BG015_008795 [Linnemannia schmuckeri]|uniref:Uncharacterized protein n=1 Tax=Linnemannia schmuckeri TaxID=64567 RepID=A0A9P5VAF0_9FUNG|nr:hypothetical protein BG015_008795 [Linnemannia schmuckeri]
MRVNKRLLSPLFSLLCIQSIATALPITQLPASRAASRYVIENPLPPAVQTHEVIRVTDTNVILISQMSNSVLLKATVDDRGVITDIGAFQLGQNTSALHGLALSQRYPGKVWVTLQKDNKLVLLDPIVNSTSKSPEVLKEIDVPAPGLGPHYVGEYGDELWSTLQDSSDVLRINYNDPSNYTIYTGLPRPIFIAQHPDNGKFYTGEDNSASIMKIDPATNTTTQLPIPDTAGMTPVGLIAGPPGRGIWFTLLGNSTQGTGTIGNLHADDTITFHKLSSSPLSEKAALLHLAFDPEADTNYTLWLLASSIINSSALDMIIKVTFDAEWTKIVSEDIVVTPTQLNKAHRILITSTNVFATELASSKLVSYYTL